MIRSRLRCGLPSICSSTRIWSVPVDLWLALAEKALADYLRTLRQSLCHMSFVIFANIFSCDIWGRAGRVEVDHVEQGPTATYD